MRHTLRPRLLAALLCLPLLGAAQNADFPIPQRSIATRDPFVVADREARMYYLVTTARREGRMALRAYESPDLLWWRDLGLVYSAGGGWMGTVDGERDHWWAPDTYLYRGRYYTIVTLTNQSKGRPNFCTLLRGGRRPQAEYREVTDGGEPVSLTPHGRQCLDGSLYVDGERRPWLVYSLEWNGPDARDFTGEAWALPLSKNLRRAAGEPFLLFRASDAAWPEPFAYGTGKAGIVDAPFLWKDEESGHLICLWSSFRGTRYCVGQAVSRSGDLRGPWEHDAAPLYEGGGHQMVFRDLDGNLRMSLHHDNNDAHMRIVTLRLSGGKFLPVEE